MRLVHTFSFLIALAFTSMVSAQVCFESEILGVSEDDRIIRILDSQTLAVIDTYEVPEDIIGFGTNVVGLAGVAYNNNTQQLFVLMLTDQPPPLDVPYLAEVDLANQIAFVAGPTGGLQFRELAFDADNELWAVAADFALLPNVYCTLNQGTGSPTDFCTLTNGDDNHGLAFDPVMGEMFHGAGDNERVFEQITSTPGPGIPCGVSSVGLSAPLTTGGGLAAFTYCSETGGFVWATDDAANNVYEVDGTGSATLLGSLTFNCSGLTERTTQVTCVATDTFVRGDVDGNGNLVGLLDGLALLNWQFAGGATPPCMKAADADNNGSVVGLIDGLFILNFQFAGGAAPQAPYPDCGEDATSPLSCDTPLVCP